MAYLPGFYQLIAQQKRDLEKTCELIPGSNSAASAVTMLASTCMFILHCKSVWWHNFHCGGNPVPMRMNCRWWKAGQGLGTRLLWWHNEDNVIMHTSLMGRDFDETMAALPPYVSTELVCMTSNYMVWSTSRGYWTEASNTCFSIMQLCTLQEMYSCKHNNVITVTWCGCIWPWLDTGCIPTQITCTCKLVWYFISKSQPDFQTFQSTHELCSQPYLSQLAVL